MNFWLTALYWRGDVWIQKVLQWTLSYDNVTFRRNSMILRVASFCSFQFAMFGINIWKWYFGRSQILNFYKFMIRNDYAQNSQCSLGIFKNSYGSKFSILTDLHFWNFAVCSFQFLQIPTTEILLLLILSFCEFRPFPLLEFRPFPIPNVCKFPFFQVS